MTNPFQYEWIFRCDLPLQDLHTTTKVRGFTFEPSENKVTVIKQFKNASKEPDENKDNCIQELEELLSMNALFSLDKPTIENAEIVLVNRADALKNKMPVTVSKSLIIRYNIHRRLEPSNLSDAAEIMARVENLSAQKKKLISSSLRLYCEGSYPNLHKAYEVIENDVGGERSVIEKGWAPKSDIKLFKRTANSGDVLGDEARHVPKKYKPPAKPMLLSTARALVAGILMKWIDTKSK
jgi:hypothetical protein